MEEQKKKYIDVSFIKSIRGVSEFIVLKPQHLYNQLPMLLPSYMVCQ